MQSGNSIANTAPCWLPVFSPRGYNLRSLQYIHFSPTAKSKQTGAAIGCCRMLLLMLLRLLVAQHATVGPLRDPLRFRSLVKN